MKTDYTLYYQNFMLLLPNKIQCCRQTTVGIILRTTSPWLAIASWQKPRYQTGGQQEETSQISRFFPRTVFTSARKRRQLVSCHAFLGHLRHPCLLTEFVVDSTDRLQIVNLMARMFWRDRYNFNTREQDQFCITASRYAVINAIGPILFYSVTLCTHHILLNIYMEKQSYG